MTTPLTITAARFVKSAPALKDAPDLGGLPEFVMVGRSNVGKSSFINSLLQRKSLAKTSNTPGKTRLINFYDIAFSTAEGDPQGIVLVDLPGYGYARVSKTMQAQWQQNLQNYLLKRETICRIFQLIDIRHGPMESDLQMFAWLKHYDLPTVPILTKVDKISRSAVVQQRHSTAQALGVPLETVIPYSAETHQGRDAVWESITTSLSRVTHQPEEF